MITYEKSKIMRGCPSMEALNPEDLDRYEIIGEVVYDMSPSPKDISALQLH
jgi:hypothetical protein